MSGVFSGLSAFGKVAGLLNKIADLFSDWQQREAGRNQERAEIASQEEKNAQDIRKIQNSVRTGADADSVLDRFQDGR